MGETRYSVRPLDAARLRDAGVLRASAAAPGRPERPALVLTGFMGTGKTETARALAQILGLDLVDTDALIEERCGMPVAEIFALRGETRFREEETKLCAELAGRRGVVIATGGGTLLDAGNLERLGRAATVVLLEASVDSITRRVSGPQTRPLLAGTPPVTSGEDVPASTLAETPLQQRIAALLDERAGAYHRIPLRLDTTRLAPHQAACRIAAWTEMPGSRLDLALPPGRGRAGASSILIGRGILSSLGLRLREAGLARRVLVFIAAGLREIFETQIAAALEEAGCTCDVVAIRDGDAAKDLEQVTEVIDALAQRNAARDAVAVGVGGGVTGDLVGLSASLYMRGIPLVLVPTTLLAQVDAGIGGKVGVNHRHAKNLIGGFYLPHLVLIDPCALRTLPDSELSSGMAEVIKTALVGSPSLYEFLAEHLDEPEGAAGEAASGAPPRAISTLRRIDFLERCVIECAAVKAAVVERDPLEAGERRVLNLGHTTAHALETVAGYRGLTHGQAVAVGLAVALRIATQRGMAAPPLLAQARRMLRNCGLPLSAPQFDEQAFAQSLRLDKKARTGSLHFVLPVSPGVISVVDNVGEQDILAALRDERDACSQEAQP